VASLAANPAVRHSPQHFLNSGSVVATLQITVTVVVSSSPEEEVIRIDTTGVIAVVTDAEFTRPLPMRHHPGDAVGEMDMAIKHEVPISLRIAGGDPFPA